MAAAVLALLAGLSGVAEAHPNTASAAGTAITAAEDAKACGPLPSFPAGTADQIMAGRLTISGFATVAIDPNRDGHINWAQDPFGNPTWLVDFQNAQWIEALIKAYLAGGPNADAYRDRAKTLLLGWLRQVPADNRTPDTLICSAEAFPGQSWIDNQIPGLLHYYASHWDGAFNHGLKQSLQLLGAGCAYPAGAFGGAARSWRETAREQMIDSFEPNALRAGDRPPRGHQRAVDRLRQLRLRPVDDGRGEPGRLRPLAARLDRVPDRADAGVPGPGDPAGRKAGPDR